MSLMPKRVKYRKSQRGRIRGNATAGNYVAFGDYGIQATEPGWLSAQVLEAARVVLSRYIGTEGRYWCRVFPHKSITAIAAARRVSTRAREMRQAPMAMKTVKTTGNSSGSMDMPSAMPPSTASNHPPRKMP